ncbi:MAG: hypothetical protein L7U87_05055 [Chlamydiales bacterium]|nr:hypothetical protein [Chlamydiales bacterium]
MLYILFSADYELFMGKNYYPEKDIMIQPTDKLLNLCSQHNVPMTLFCDYLCLQWFYNQGNTQFPKAVEHQLQNAIYSGHDVQTHLHPHWPFTKRNKDTFSYPHQTFLLGGQSLDEQECYQLARKYLKCSKEYFEGLLQKIIPSYECIAYRAGGYGIQPHTNAIFQALVDTGYYIDSSVVPGMLSQNHVNRIDFRKYNKQSSYITLPSEDKIFEIPLASAHFTLKERLSLYPNFASIFFNRFKSRLNQYTPPRINRGAAIQVSHQSTPSTFERAVKRLAQPIMTKWMQLELSPSLKLMQQTTLNYLKSLPKGTNGDFFFSFSCHPKAMYREHFIALDLYCSWLKNYFGEEVKAIHYQDAKKILSEKQIPSQKEREYAGHIE